MTKVPHRFGSHRDEPEKEPTKCFFGKKCEDTSYGCCKIHNLTQNHFEGVIALSALALMITVLLGVIGITMWMDEVYDKPIRQNINGYNCNQLAEYIADKSKEWNYAQHRYGWLCVNEQVKEFQK